MALVNGSDYDHIDLHSVAGGDVTRHMLKDAQARQDQEDAILRDVDAQAREDAWRTAQARLAAQERQQAGNAPRA